jgi:hypothetical protein
MEEIQIGDKVVHKNRKKYPFWYTVIEVDPFYRDLSLSRIWVTLGSTGQGMTFFFARDLEIENG